MTPEEPEVTSNQPENADDIKPPSKFLKFLVVGQGIAIVILVVIIIVTIVYRAFFAITESTDDSTAVVVPASETTQAVMEVTLGQVKAPEGSVLKQIHAGDVVATLEFRHENGNTTLIFVDVATGSEKSRLIIQAH